MYGLLVGGYLPGTNIQLSFQAYLALMALLVGGTSYYKAHRQFLVAHLSQPLQRHALHASQLHRRAL